MLIDFQGRNAGTCSGRLGFPHHNTAFPNSGGVCMPFLRVDLWTFVFEVDIPIFLSVFLSFLSFLSFGLGPVFRFRKKTDLTGTS